MGLYMLPRARVLAGAIFILACAYQVRANGIYTFPGDRTAPKTWTFSVTEDGGTRAAQAVFEIMDDVLTITLTNRASKEAWEPTDVLTALFFHIDGAPNLTVGEALIQAGSVAHRLTTVLTVPGGDVSTEWAYLEWLGYKPAAYGISVSGLGDMFGPGDRFNVNGDLWPPASPDGLQGGITSLSDDWGTANGGLAKAEVITDSVVFTLTGASGISVDDDIFDVWFHYGTDGPLGGGEEPPVIPEPLTMLGVLLGIGGLTRYVARRRMA